MEEDYVDVHKRLFNDAYYVYAPYSATVSENDLLESGVVGFHDKEGLADYLNSPVLTRVNIATLAELVVEGEAVQIVNKRDVKIIFDLVTQHLRNWLHIARTQSETFCPPLKDLIALDTLAESMYPYIPPPKLEEHKYTALEIALGKDVLLGAKKPKPVQRARKPYKPYTNHFIELGVK